MLNWKPALVTVLLFTFVGLPAIGQEMNVPSLQKLDVLAWSSQVMMSKENTPHLDNGEVEIATEAGEFSELKLGLNKLERLHSEAGEPESAEKETGVVPFLKNVFSSAMSF